MTLEYVRLEGKDLGVITANHMLVYKPQNELVPKFGMLGEELQKCVPRGTISAIIPYEFVRLVMVNQSPVWRNRDVFDLKSLGEDSTQSYYGRGDVAIEFRSDVGGVDQLVRRILDKHLGLEITERT